MTFLEIIQDAYEVIGYLSRGVQLSEADKVTALRSVSQILGSWSEEGYMVSAIAKRTTPLVVGQISYTIGAAGADITAARPIDIVSAYIRDSGGTDHWLRIMTADQYSAIQDKSLSGRPDALFYLPSAPNGTIYLSSKPDAIETLCYDAEEPISEPSTVTETMTLAPGYRLALKWALVIELAPKKHMAVDPMWREQDQKARAAISTRAAASRISISRPEFDQVYPGYRFDIMADT